MLSFVWALNCRSQWPRGLRRRSSAARLLRLWDRIPPGAWMFVCCECCVLSGRGLCGGLITRPEESYRLWRVVVCDHKTSKTRRLKPLYRAVKIQPRWFVTPRKQQQLRIKYINGWAAPLLRPYAFVASPKANFYTYTTKTNRMTVSKLIFWFMMSSTHNLHIIHT